MDPRPGEAAGVASAATRGGLAELEWELATARSGDATLRVGGHAVHSAYDPRREAEDLARNAVAEARRDGADALLLLGLGLGYFPEALHRAHRGEPGSLIVFDPFPELSAALPIQPGPWRRAVRVERGWDALDARLRALAREKRRPHWLVHPGYTEICHYEQRLLAIGLRRHFTRGGGPALGDCVVSRRALDALVRLPFRRTLADLADCCAGQTAVIAAPGPSLRAALPALATRRGGVLFAAVQALRTLQQAGVRVDFAVAPDPLHSTPFLRGFEPRFGWLLAETAVEPELLDRWPERTALFALRSSQLSDLAFARLGDEPIDEPLNTVSETALLLAHRLGARRIALAGVDLCGAEKGRFRARRASGEAGLTNPAYFHAARYLSHLCPRLERDGAAFWRVGDGLRLEGVRPLGADGLAALLAEAPGFEPPEPRAVRDASRRALVRELLHEAAAAPRARGGRGAAPDVDPRNRWSPFAELRAGERADAVRQALRRVDQAYDR